MVAALPEATVFETGANRWRQFDHWPPRAAQNATWYFAADGQLAAQPPADNGADAFISDPRKPVPYTTEITTRWARDYVTEDQRFAAWRPDVLVYRGPVAQEDFTIAGPIEVDMWVDSTGSDADWIVKLVDEYPGEPVDGSKPAPGAADAFPSGRQELVRAGIFRGRFRESFETPVPMEPGKPARIRFALSDVMHTIRPGHRLMIQVQSTFFPFIDRNPQKYVPNIFDAKADDFIAATHRLLRSPEMPSQIRVPVLQP
jgi:predicted acyl esterase